MARQQASGQSAPNRYYGKYRGRVIDNVDPLFLGRIIPEVPALSGMVLNWALPCTPYAGEEVGFYAIPPIGANVWIEFEAGDPHYPIWSGCFWAPGETPFFEGPPDPGVKIFKTEFLTMVLSDLPDVGGFFLTVSPAAVASPLSMTFNSTGIEINDAPGIISMVTEEGITITYPPSIVSLTEEAITSEIPASTLVLTEEATELNSPEINFTAEGNLSAEAGLAMELTAGGDMSLDAVGAIEVSAVGDVSIEAVGACEVSAVGDVAISAVGACEVTAAADVAVTAAGACEVTGGGTVAITGATIELLGVATVDGVPVI
jgi:hypothetical protein